MINWIVRLLALSSEKALIKSLVKNAKLISKKGLKGYISKRANRALLRKNRAYNPTQLQKQLKTRLKDKYKYVGNVPNSSWIQSYDVLGKKLKFNNKWYDIKGINKEWVNSALRARSFGVRLWDTLWLHKRRNAKGKYKGRLAPHILEVFKREQKSFISQTKRKAHIGSIKGIVKTGDIKNSIKYRQSISSKMLKKLIF